MVSSDVVSCRWYSRPFLEKVDTSDAANAIQPIGHQTMHLVVDRRSCHLHVKGTIGKSDLGCEKNVQKRSRKGTTTTAHATWHARCEDGCSMRHKHKLEPREKNSRVRKC